MKRILINLDKCIGCRSCEIACATEHTPPQDLALLSPKERRQLARMRVRCGLIELANDQEGKPVFGQVKTKIPKGKAYPIHCRHCDEPKCVEACMSGALAKADDGAVRHDGIGCVRCWMCIMACPYGAILIDPKGKSILKCDLCPSRETPACVEACKTGALVLVFDADRVANVRADATAEGG
ncbi:MAG: 4Fe-4S dicluster domain-containing protein [Methanomassiliicoccales archaeon]|nr:4Fe-4S dicluster domain-containing protein [Methanomassiliicoccales archaeon]